MPSRTSPLSGLRPELRAAILREAHRRQAQIWPPNPWHAAMALGFAGWAQRLFESPILGPLLALAAGACIAASRWHLATHFDAVYGRSPRRSLRLQVLLHLALAVWLAAWLYLGIRDNGLSLRSFLLCTVAAAVATGAIVIPPPAVALARAHVAILAAAVLAGGLRLGLDAQLPLAALSVVSFALYLLYLIETHQSERWLGFVAGQIAEERARQLEEGSTSLRHAFFSLEDEVRARTEELQKATAEYRAIFEGVHDGIVVFRPEDELILMANSTAGQMYGLPAGELVGRSLLEFSTDAETGRRHVAATLARDSQYRFRTVHRRVDGRQLELEVNASLIEHEGRPAILSLNRDLTVQREAEHLRLEKEAAERAAALKGQFLANVSHDIRTPVAGIIGLAGLLAKEPLSPSQKERVELLQSSATGLLRLLDDVLDLSRIEAGHLSIEQVPFQLLRPARFVLDLVGLEARHKQLRIDLQPALGLPEWVLGDESRVRQMLMNLVSNAVKFTPRGGVTVALEAAAPGMIRFSVTDTGVGVPETLRQRIFEPFSQGDPSTSRRHGGVGLGLSICRRLVERMGGSIDFESRPGEGSSFWFTVPLPATAAPGALAPVAAGGQPVAKRLRVLVVEDNVISRLVLVAQLRLLGSEVEVSADGEAALRLASTRAYDLVLLDLQMPGIDGFETARRLRAETLPPGIPIVAVSAHAGAQEEAKCRRFGIDRLMSKPLGEDELRGLLNSCGAAASAAASAAAAGATKAAAEEPVLNAGRVALLRQLGDTRDGGLLLDLARQLAAGGAIRALNQALAGEDFAAARRLLHSLKGSALNVGAKRLAELAASLEAQLDPGPPAGGLERRIEELQERLDEAIAALAGAAARRATGEPPV